MWMQCGWVDESEAKWLKDMFGTGDALVGSINDEAECSVQSTPASSRMGLLKTDGGNLQCRT